MTSNQRFTRASARNPRAQRAFAREVIALVPLAARIRRSVADRQTARAAAVLMRRPEFVDLMSNVLERMHLGIFQEEIIEPVPILSEDELNAFRVLVRGPEDNPYEPIRVAPGAPLRPPAGPHTPPRGWCSRRLIFESPRQDPTEPPPSSPQYEPVSPQYEPVSPRSKGRVMCVCGEVLLGACCGVRSGRGVLVWECSSCGW